MNIKTALRADQHIRMALVGAGGKTSTMFKLARELTGSVMVSCTTHLGRDQVILADRHLVLTDINQISKLEIKKDEVLLVTGDVFDHERISGLEPDIMDSLYAYCENEGIPLIIEADGSRKKPLKAPAKHEPAIPSWINYVVVVAGYSSIHQEFGDEIVHRPEIFQRLTGIKESELITCDHLASMLLHKDGGLKNIPAKAERAVLVTQVDSIEKQADVMRMAPRLFQAYQRMVIADKKQERIMTSEGEIIWKSIVCSVVEPVAGVILAAGGSTRFGEPKIMLPWHGKPLVRSVAETALAAGLSPLIVVLGAVQQPVREALADLPVVFVENQQWATGQSSSVISAIRSLPENTGATVVMLADQPHIPITLVNELMTEHRNNLDAIIAPQVEGKRGNPVLLDKTVFSDLLSLEGDAGARMIFSRFPVAYIPWNDNSILLDVDTPEDYQKLMNLM